MTLKQEIINIEGRSITLNEISFGAMLRLQRNEKFSIEEMYKEMMSAEDFAYLNTVGKAHFQAIREAFQRLQEVDKLNTDYEKKNS